MYNNKKMKLFSVLVQESSNRVFFGLLSGIITGIGFSLLIPLVMISLSSPSVDVGVNVDVEQSVSDSWLKIVNPTLAAVFFGLCITLILLKTIAQSVMATVAIDAASSLRQRIFKRINKAPLAQLETIGNGKLMSIITGDIPRIVAGVSAIPDLLISVITVVSILIFMAFINFDALLFILIAIVFGLVTYHLPLLLGQHQYTRSRAFYDSLHESIRGVLSGAKELKLNRKKRDAFFKNQLLKNENKIKSKEKLGFCLMQAANNYGDLISFIIIGIIVFILNSYIEISQEQLFGVTIAMIYMISPIHGVLQCLPLISVGNVSLKRLNWLMDNLDEEPSSSKGEMPPNWEKLQLKHICYNYYDKNSDQDEFRLGPVNLTLNKGEVTFIVGGNGSGKSTLSKIITQHYFPTKGQVFFDDIAVTAENRDAYRQDISAIYSDYYLFKSILGHEEAEVDTIVSAYIDELGLEGKLTIDNGELSTIKLSDGQKRRLALLIALLDDRDLYLFDEWAADQDPAFKRVFYHHHLRELKKKNKAVVVITHDDRYFDLADKVIWMESGKVAKITRPKGGSRAA